MEYAVLCSVKETQVCLSLHISDDSEIPDNHCSLSHCHEAYSHVLGVCCLFLKCPSLCVSLCFQCQSLSVSNLFSRSSSSQEEGGGLVVLWVKTPLDSSDFNMCFKHKFGDSTFPKVSRLYTMRQWLRVLDRHVVRTPQVLLKPHLL